MEIERVASHYIADIIIAQETCVGNSEYRQTENYNFWTASDKKAKENKGNDIKESKKIKGRGKGERPECKN